MEWLVSLAGELAKGFVSEVGAAGARALLDGSETPANGHTARQEIPNPAHDPLGEAEQAAHGFFQCLAAADHESAWMWCDPSWPHDAARSQSCHDTFSFAPPIGWSVRERYVPEHWQPGEWLDWVALDVVVTYDNGDGSFAAHAALVGMVLLDAGWRIGEIVWNHGSHPAADEDGMDDSAHLLVQCERCPEQLSVPDGSGPFRTRCPACWTPQTIDRDAASPGGVFDGWQPVVDDPRVVVRCERCPEHMEIAAGQGRVWVKCPSCWTPQEVDT